MFATEIVSPKGKIVKRYNHKDVKTPLECLVLSDCTGATDKGNHDAALKMITMQGGVFGAHASSHALIETLG